MRGKIHIYDTTLRDGTQGEGISLSCDDKLRIARRLDDFGVHYIEGGWPGSNPKDMEFFKRVQSELDLRNSKVTAFGSTCKPNTNPDDDQQLQLLMEANTAVVTIFGKSWTLHVDEVLRTTNDENLRMIRESVQYFKSNGKEVIYDAEHFFDGYKTDSEYALATLQAAVIGGADAIVLCDTNGGTLPWEIGDIVGMVNSNLVEFLFRSKERQDRLTTLGIHTHNDSGMAVANALAAVKAGCLHIQGTINGYGERCGNADLISIIPNLQLKMGYQTVADDRLGQLLELSHFIAEVSNQNANAHQPFVGQSAFAHKGGVHANAMAKNQMSYQHIDPTLVGNRMRILVSELSGKVNISSKGSQLGIEHLSQENESHVLMRIKEMEHSGFVFEGADASFEMLLNRTDENYEPPFELLDYTTSVEHYYGRDLISKSTMKIKVREQIFHKVSEGDGPIHALNNALIKALRPKFPFVQGIQLTDYKVRILDGHRGFDSVVRVLIDFSDGTSTWSTVGASGNIVEASWLALSDSVEYFILKQ